LDTVLGKETVDLHQVRGFAPIGMMAYWNNGKEGFRDHCQDSHARASRKAERGYANPSFND